MSLLSFVLEIEADVGGKLVSVYLFKYSFWLTLIFKQFSWFLLKVRSNWLYFSLTRVFLYSFIVKMLPNLLSEDFSRLVFLNYWLLLTEWTRLGFKIEPDLLRVSSFCRFTDDCMLGITMLWSLNFTDLVRKLLMETRLHFSSTDFNIFGLPNSFWDSELLLWY